MKIRRKPLYASEITIENITYIPADSDGNDTCEGCQIEEKRCENLRSSCVGIIWIKKEVFNEN